MHLLKQEFNTSALLVVLVLLCMFGCLQPTLAQSKAIEPRITNDKPFKSVFLKLNPLAALQGQIPLTSEYRLGLEFVGNQNLSYCLFGSYITKSPILSASLQSATNQNPRSYEFKGYRVQGQLRYYAVKFANQKRLSGVMNPSGMYVAAHTSFALANFKLKSANLPRQEWSNFNLIGLFGIQALASDDFGIDFFMGAGYKRNLVVDYDFMGRKNPVNVNQAYGNYYGSSFKFSVGFNLVFGLF